MARGNRGGLRGEVPPRVARATLLLPLVVASPEPVGSLGLAIAVDPIPLMTFLIVLPSRRGTRNGGAFVSGWLVSLAIVVTVTGLATDNRPPRPHTAPGLPR
jgi:hypothetical protein